MIQANEEYLELTTKQLADLLEASDKKTRVLSF